MCEEREVTIGQLALLWQYAHRSILSALPNIYGEEQIREWQPRFWAKLIGLVLMVIYWIALSVVASALSAIFRCALYLYATEGRTPPAFSASYVEQAFAVKPAKKVKPPKTHVNQGRHQGGGKPDTPKPDGGWASRSTSSFSATIWSRASRRVAASRSFWAVTPVMLPSVSRSLSSRSRTCRGESASLRRSTAISSSRKEI